ncbi:MAG: hypothetical protein R3F48_02555 [Candidatus Zixiibacteriota bacterium]
MRSNNRLILPGIVFCSIALCGFAVCQDDSAGGFRINDETVVTVSGFGDFVSTIKNHSEEQVIEVGQAEIGFESDLRDHLAASLAIAYDVDRFTIGSFIIDYTAAEASEESPLPLGMQALTIGGGQFDVPFGIGSQQYASADRRLVSSPLVTVHTHDEWNDIGGYARADAAWGNVTVFLSNGFDFERIGANDEEVFVPSNIAAGGRIGLAPLAFFEIGTSYADLLDRSGDKTMDMIGVDFTATLQNLDMRAEFIRHRFSDPIYDVYEHEGYYVQATYIIGRASITGRYDRFDSDKYTDGYLRRVCVGGALQMGDYIEFRSEYQFNHDKDNAALLQMVFMF